MAAWRGAYKRISIAAIINKRNEISSATSAGAAKWRHRIISKQRKMRHLASYNGGDNNRQRHLDVSYRNRGSNVIVA